MNKPKLFDCRPSTHLLTTYLLCRLYYLSPLTIVHRREQRQTHQAQAHEGHDDKGWADGARRDKQRDGIEENTDRGWQHEHCCVHSHSSSSSSSSVLNVVYNVAPTASSPAVFADSHNSMTGFDAQSNDATARGPRHPHSP